MSLPLGLWKIPMPLLQNLSQEEETQELLSHPGK